MQRLMENVFWRCVLISKEVSEEEKKKSIICPRFVEEAKGSVSIYGGRFSVHHQLLKFPQPTPAYIIMPLVQTNSQCKC